MLKPGHTAYEAADTYRGANGLPASVSREQSPPHQAAES